MRNHFGKEGESWIIIFLSDLAAAESEITWTSQRTSCISNQSLHKTLTWAEWKLLLRGILDLVQLRAFKNSLDFLKTRLDKCLPRLAYVVGVLWAGGKLSHFRPLEVSCRLVFQLSCAVQVLCRTRWCRSRKNRGGGICEENANDVGLIHKLNAMLLMPCVCHQAHCW